VTPHVIILAANNAYRDHAKSLMVNCRRVGRWDGDFAIVCPQDFDSQDLDRRGICIFRTPEPTWNNTVKFRVFHPFFRRWQQALYLDCDILVQRDLRPACDELAKRFPSILMDGSQALPGTAGTTILQDWEHFDRLSGGDPESHPHVYQRMREKFPHIDQPIFVASAMFFAPATIPDGATDAMLAVQEEFKEANPRAYDQQTMNLILYDQMASSGKDFVTWWAFDSPGNRVASETRGWRGDEFPAIVHYWGSFAPWLDKTPDAGAYANERLGRVCRELYLENLAAFDQEFSIR
jgi:lipopolysaccharide biosynthesis glycosyltransferase